MSIVPPRVAIIGIGPSGLAAAHAVYLWDGIPHLASKDLKPSPLYGCQYLHAPIPKITPIEPETLVQYKLEGSEADYRRKVYGEGFTGPVSPERFREPHNAWDLRRAYRKLYESYVEAEDRRGTVTPLVITPDRLLAEADKLRGAFDMVISTVPAPNLCVRPGEHSFNSQNVYASGSAPDLGVEVPISTPGDTVICNGFMDVSWYRASRVFGYATVEWSEKRRPPYEGVKLIQKPLWTDCNCFPWIHRLGRFGSWRKSILVHDVFEQATLLMKFWHGHSVITKRRDWCHKCGWMAYREQVLLEPQGGVEYRCLNGHTWSDKNG